MTCFKTRLDLYPTHCRIFNPLFPLHRPCDPPHAVPDAAGHLSPSHLAYFLHWSLLLRLEAAHAADKASMARLWCLPAAERQRRGQALAGCRLRGVQHTPAGWVHRLERPAGAPAAQMAAGDLVMVGTEQTLAVCMGSLLEMAETEAHVLLDREGGRRGAGVGVSAAGCCVCVCGVLK